MRALLTEHPSVRSVERRRRVKTAMKEEFVTIHLIEGLHCAFLSKFGALWLAFIFLSSLTGNPEEGHTQPRRPAGNEVPPCLFTE